MKKIMLVGIVGMLLLSSSIHIGVMYLRYARTLGLGFSPGISLVKKTIPIVLKDLQVKF